MGATARLASRSPAEALLGFFRNGTDVPGRLLVSELSRVLSGLLDAHLNHRQPDPAQWGLLAEILYHLEVEEEEATATGDAVTAFVVKRDGRMVSPALCRAHRLWGKLVATHTPPGSGRRRVRACWRHPDASRGDFASAELGAFCRRAAGALAPFCLEFVLHGSASDRTMTPFSDIDTWMVVRREVFDSPEALDVLRERVGGLLRIVRILDPLQHHGLFVATEYDLETYSEARFPLVLLDTATSVLGAPEIEVATAEDGVERAHALFRMATNIEAACERRDPSPYEVKLLASWVMLLPALHLQVQNGPAYKPDALARAKRDFSPAAWSAVESASELRRRWPPSNPAALLRTIDPDFHAHARQLAREALERFDAADIRDSNWDTVEPGRKSGRPVVTEHPALYERKDLEGTLRSEAARLESLPGAPGIYAAGNVRDPVLGISDLDLVAVFRKEPPLREVAEALLRAGGKGTPVSAYIRCHEALVASEVDLPILEAYFGAPLVPATTGAPTRPPVGDSGQENVLAIVRLFREGTQQLFKLLELRDAAALPLRTALLRAHSVVHDIAIARDVYGFRRDAFEAYAERIGFLRKSWFHLKEADRCALAAQYPRIGALILHIILTTVSKALEADGHLSSRPIADRAPFRVAFPGGEAVFSGHDTGETLPEYGSKAAFPLATLPMIACCFPGISVDPPMTMEDARRCMAPPLFDAATRAGIVFARSMVFQQRLLQMTGSLTAADRKSGQGAMYL